MTVTSKEKLSMSLWSCGFYLYYQCRILFRTNFQLYNRLLFESTVRVTNNFELGNEVTLVLQSCYQSLLHNMLAYVQFLSRMSQSHRRPLRHGIAFAGLGPNFISCAFRHKTQHVKV